MVFINTSFIRYNFWGAHVAFLGFPGIPGQKGEPTQLKLRPGPPGKILCKNA